MKITSTVHSVICHWIIQRKEKRDGFGKRVIWVRNMQTALLVREKSQTVLFVWECVCLCMCVYVWQEQGPYFTRVSGDELGCISPSEEPSWMEGTVSVCVLTSRCRFPRHIIYTLHSPKWDLHARMHTLTHRNRHTGTNTHCYWLHKFSNILAARKLALP